jgi:hypothetical protein
LNHSLSAFRFDHYEILTREDGTPLELGRGAMGVTYKAIDINLQCAVALKVINARFIGDLGYITGEYEAPIYLCDASGRILFINPRSG